MTRRPCPHCSNLNPLDNRFCGQCGESLTVRTIIFSQDEHEPYRVETTAPALPQPRHVRQAVAVGAAAVAAELALVFVEQRLLRGRSLGSGHMRQVRNGALSTVAGAALLFAEQTLARPGTEHAGR